jgi:hypothetical protein
MRSLLLFIAIFMPVPRGQIKPVVSQRSFNDRTSAGAPWARYTIAI